MEYEQGGQARAEYGKGLLQHLSAALTTRFGRGFSVDNLETMRLFYLAYPSTDISGKALQPTEKSETLSRKFDVTNLAERFPLTWSHYVLLVRRTRSPEARAFYEA